MFLSVKFPYFSGNLYTPRLLLNIVSIIESFYARNNLTLWYLLLLFWFAFRFVIVFMQIFTYARRHTFHAQRLCRCEGVNLVAPRRQQHLFSSVCLHWQAVCPSPHSCLSVRLLVSSFIVIFPIKLRRLIARLKRAHLSSANHLNSNR